MGDKRRFELLASFVARLIPYGERMATRVADVAAGKGALSWALRRHGFLNITPFEPEPRRGGHVVRLGIAVRDFTPDDAARFDVLVGMHPDEATDCMLEGAARHGALVVVSPCCTRPRAWPYAGDRKSQDAWIAHLVVEAAARGLALEEGRLPMHGANAVLWGARS